MYTICVAAQKGGTAKTSTCAALGLGLHGAGKRVLYIDCDVQHNLTDMIAESEIRFTLADVLTGDVTIDQAAVETPQGTLVAASGRLADPRIDQGYEGLETLRNAIQSIRKKFDVVLIDTHPEIGKLTDAAMMAADALILPVKTDRFSWSALTEISNNIDRMNAKRTVPLEILGVLPVMYNGRTNTNKFTLEAITEQANELGYPILTPIRRGVAIEEMQYGANLYASKSGPAADYMEAVNTVLKRIKKGRK